MVPPAADSPTSELDDEALMGRVAGGDGAACRLLVDRHLGSIVNFSYRMLGDRTEAEDIAQETFLRLWKTASRWEPKAKLTTWLHRVARNLCIDRLRTRRDLPSSQVPERADTAAGASTQMERMQLDQAVGRALSVLSEGQRSAISLVYYQGMSNKEAAEVMGLQVDALESLLARGRRSLRKQLQAEHAADRDDRMEESRS